MNRECERQRALMTSAQGAAMTQEKLKAYSCVAALPDSTSRPSGRRISEHERTAALAQTMTAAGGELKRG